MLLATSFFQLGRHLNDINRDAKFRSAGTNDLFSAIGSRDDVLCAASWTLERNRFRSLCRVGHFWAGDCRAGYCRAGYCRAGHGDVADLHLLAASTLDHGSGSRRIEVIPATTFRAAYFDLWYFVARHCQHCPAGTFDDFSRIFVGNIVARLATGTGQGNRHGCRDSPPERGTGMTLELSFWQTESSE